MNLKNIRCILMFIITTTIFTEGKSHNDNIKFGLSPIPIHYKLKLIPSIKINVSDNAETIHQYKNVFFDGESKIIINILHSTSNIRLQKLNQNITNSTLITRNGIIYKMDKFTYHSEEKDSVANLLELHFSDVLLPGFYSLKMEFISKRTNDNEGLLKNIHKNKNGNTEWMIATYVPASGARQFFPCWDEPHLKATFEISIKQHRNVMVLSNMPTTIYWFVAGPNMFFSNFESTPPISTYQIAIVMMNYIPFRINEKMILWCRESLKQHSLMFAMHVIENVTLYLESEFKEIKIPKLDHVVTPNFPHDGTSKWGLIFYREADIIYHEELDPFMRKIEIARLIAYKIAYQWFGNALSPYSWSSLWLHDGLATLFGEEAIFKSFLDSGIMNFFIVQNQYESLHLDSTFDMNPPQVTNLSELYSFFSFPHYIKAPIVLRMLQNAITDTVFRKGVHTCLQKYAFRSLSPSEFWSVQEDLIYSAKVSIPFSITRDFPTWLVYRTYPIVNLTQEDLSSWRLAQNFNTTSYGRWWIFINIFKTSFSASFLHKSIQLLLTPQKPYYEVKDVGKTELILVNIQQAGYYRVNYEDDWGRIAYHLYTNYKAISVINRAKIIDDVIHFTITRQLNISMFWGFTYYLKQETDYSAWYPMIKMIEYVSNMIPFRKHPINIKITEKLELLLSNLLQILAYRDYPTENNFIKCLRQEITKLACTFGYNQCLMVTKQRLQLHLEDPVTNKILPEWKKWTYCNGLRESDKSAWITVKNIFLKKPNHEFLSYLACTRDRSIILQDLAYLLRNSTTNETDIVVIHFNITIFHSIVSKILSDSLNIPMTFFVNIKPKEISPIVAITDIINHLYSEDQLNEILSMLEKKLYITNEKHISKIRRKVQTRLSEIKNQIDHFQFIKP